MLVLALALALAIFRVESKESRESREGREGREGKKIRKAKANANAKADKLTLNNKLLTIN